MLKQVNSPYRISLQCLAADILTVGYFIFLHPACAHCCWFVRFIGCSRWRRLYRPMSLSCYTEVCTVHLYRKWLSWYTSKTVVLLKLAGCWWLWLILRLA